VQAEALVRNLPAFARFLPVAALFHGQVLNLASVSRDAMVARAMVDDYLAILEDTHLAFRLPSFGAGLRVRERVRPKLYWCDPGLVRALRGRRGAVMPEERGPLLEGFVAMVLRAYAEHRKAFQSLSSWAPREGRLEVDFLASRGDEHVAIELKASTRFRPEDPAARVPRRGGPGPPVP
jgi:predicted AAA+ superfamily ATPase